MANSKDLQSLTRESERLRAEVSELRKALAVDLSKRISSRGTSYENGLKDAEYKKCEKCGEVCVPTCVGCDGSEWEMASQTYFDEMTNLKEWRHGVESALLVISSGGGGGLADLLANSREMYMLSQSSDGDYAAGFDSVMEVFSRLVGSPGGGCV